MLHASSHGNSDSPAPAASPLGVVAFVAGGMPFTMADVLAAGWFRGDLQPCWQEFLLDVACEEQAMADELECDTAALQLVSEEVRYRHELITSEETEAWLTAHRLTLDDLAVFCSRQVWRESHRHRVSAPALDFATATAEQHALLLNDLLFSGELRRFSEALAWRVAASLASNRATPAAEEIATQRQAFLARTHLTADSLAEALVSLGRDERWFGGQLQLEACYEAVCAQVRTPENRQRTLAALQLPLTQFELETIDLESEGAVREACFCLEVDGVSMAELAQQERCRVEQRRVLLEELSEELQIQFLAAEKGQVRTIVSSDRFQVCRIVSKAKPTLADDEVVVRIDRDILAAHFSHLASKHIVWPGGGES